MTKRVATLVHTDEEDDLSLQQKKQRAAELRKLLKETELAIALNSESVTMHGIVPHANHQILGPVPIVKTVA